VIREKAHVLRTAFFFALGLSSFLLLSSCLRTEAQTQSAGYVQGQILVKFKKTVSAERIEEINQIMGAEIIKIIRGIRVYQLRIPDDRTVPEMVKEYTALPEVEYAEPNYQVHIPTPPKD
jgi:thermitase